MRTSTTLVLAALLVLGGSALAFECKHNSDCADADPCTTDRCVRPGKTCQHTPITNGAACNDGNACTIGDTCQSGVCTGAPTTCIASDQCHVAGTCNPSTGVCTDPNAPDGTPCNDRDLCTQVDACETGTCVGSNEVVCTAIDLCHLAGVCSPQTGFCSNPPINPLVCTPVDQCNTAGTCDPPSGACTTPNKPDGSSCNDGDLCTQTDGCVAGACTGTDPVVCDAPPECQSTPTCDPTLGTCTSTPLPDGTPCTVSGGVACSAGSACQSGTCVVGGGGDSDGDGVCDADDDCPLAVNSSQRDLDGDGQGDECDPADAVLAMARVRAKKSRGHGSNGFIIARGTFVVTAPDSFGAQAGVTAHLTDSSTLDVSETFAPTECRTSKRGRVHCRRADDTSTQAKFIPLADGPGHFRFLVRLGHQSVPGPLAAPVTLTVTDDVSIDRVGAMAACHDVAAGMSCP